MSLAALAVVGRQGTPLYMRDFAATANLNFGMYSQGVLSDAELFGDDLLEEEGFDITNEKSMEEWPCQLRYQFMLHSACRQLEEVLKEGRWKSTGSGADACWVGILLTSDNFKAYGYVTTNVRYVCLAEDSISPENVQALKSYENELKVLFANVHRMYTDNLLNPFASPHTKITSNRFNLGVISLASNFNR